MEKLLKEDQQGFKLRKGNFKHQKHTRNQERPAYFLEGITYPVNSILKRNRKKITKDYQGIYGGDDYDNNWIFLIDRDPVTGEYLEDQTKQNKINPLIQKINQLKKWSISFQKLDDELEDYIPPSEEPKTEEEAAEAAATKEDIDKIIQNLENFQRRFLNLENSEEIKETVKLINQIESAHESVPDLSTRNKIAVNLQNPNATKVAPKSQWEKIWNKTVNKNAKAIYVLTVTSSAKPPYEIQRDFLVQKGVRSYGQLKPRDKELLKKLKNKATYSTASEYRWMPFYDISDTTQIEGTPDEYAEYLKNSSDAKQKLAGRKNPFDDGVKSTDNPELITNINTSLKKFAKELNVPGVNPNASTSLSETKGLARQVLTKLLDETYAKEKGGVFKTLHSSVKTEQARKEQAEVASWGFMEAFGINVALSDININLIWGDKTKIKDELQPKQQRFAIQSIDKSVKYLVGYVNTEMKKVNNISETEGQTVIGKAPSIMDYAKKLGMQDIFNESNVIQELHERIVRKLMKRI